MMEAVSGLPSLLRVRGAAWRLPSAAVWAQSSWDAAAVSGDRERGRGAGDKA